MITQLKQYAGVRAALLCMCLTANVAGCRGLGEEMRLTFQESGCSEESLSSLADSSKEESLSLIFIHVAGQVQTPGVYALPRDSRVFEAIEAAGGFLETAAYESVNLARVLSDGEQIYVWHREEFAFAWKESAEEGMVKVDLNIATLQQLMTLPGIGQTKAQAILDYRKEHGAFGSVEQLMEVPGIKASVYEKLKAYIVVNGTSG